MICLSCGHQNDSESETCFGCGQPLAPAAVIRQGSVVGSRYEILSLLGRGGMGVVYRARDRVLDEVVALKVLRVEGSRSEDLARRFLSEIKLARRVTHSNVCRIHDYGEEPGLSYISMELLQGTDLRKLLAERGRLPAADAYAITAQVADGLQAIHAEGIVHRDLKTPNIMVDGRGVVKLMDFGIAKQVTGGGSGVTATGHVVGTPEYMSPEQARGHDVDSRSDIYALGVVVFEAFTGRVPFRGKTPIDTILMHIHDPPPLDGPEATGLPPSLLPVLRRTLAKEPGDRFASAAEAGAALRAASRGDGAGTVVEAWAPTEVDTPVSPTATTAAQLRPRRASTLPLWLLSVAVVAVAAGLLLRTRTASLPQMASATPPTSLALPEAPAPTAPAPSPQASAAPTLSGLRASSAPTAAPTRLVAALPAVPPEQQVTERAGSAPPVTLPAVVEPPATVPAAPVPSPSAAVKESASPVDLLLPGLASKDPSVQARAMFELQKLQARAVPGLAKALRSGDPELRAAGARGLLRLGPGVVPAELHLQAMVQALHDRDALVRRAAVLALDKIGVPAVPVLKGTLEEGEPAARIAAGRALMAIGPPAVAPALYLQALSQAARDGEASVRAEVAKALAPLGSAAVPLLVELLKDKDASVTAAAVQSVGRIGGSALTALTPPLKDPDPAVRRAAARSILAVGRPSTVSSQFIAALAEALRDEDSQVRDMALEVLGSLGPAAQSAVPALKLLRQENKANPFLTERIDEVLGKIKGGS